VRVLDLGCGRAASSIFLHRELGVQVWATDLWFSASANLQRIRDAGAESGVFPIHAWWTPSHWCLHSAAWWRRHWERTGISGGAHRGTARFLCRAS
jgi:cyclopropane fatty-acyl-phospholipid synthase-like methyltransferase